MGALDLTEQGKTFAVVDVGSNAIRLMVAQADANGSAQILERLQRPARLGHSTFITGKLSQKTMNAAVVILRDFRRVCDTYGVSVVRAVATSAIREAANADSFLDRAVIASGFEIEIIEPAEESRLTVAAVRQSLQGTLDVNKGKVLIVHIGGGSGLLTVLKSGEIAASESYNLGSIRLQEVLKTTEETPQRAAALLRKQIDNFVTAILCTMPIRGVDQFVAAGGDARIAAQLVGTRIDDRDMYAVSARDLDQLAGKCAKQTIQGLTRAYSLTFAEAETLTPALLVYLALLKATQAPNMIISQVSMRDGLLLSLMRTTAGREDPELTTSALQSAQAIAEKYHCDAAHASHVAEMGLRLFDALKDVHRLPPRCRLLLHVASLIHEVGGFVSSRSHHKHSYYLISNAVIFGLPKDELEMVALVARYHRGNGPRLTHREYMALTHEHRIVVTKLAAILRVADALDRTRSDKLKGFTVECRPDECIVTAPDAPDLTLEQKALERKGGLFEDAYGMRLRLEAAEAPAPGQDVQPTLND